MRKENMLVLSVREMADRMQVSMPTAYMLTESEGFPVIRVGRKKLIPIADLERWISEKANNGRVV